jgi:hypothetical protein
MNLKAIGLIIIALGFVLTIYTGFDFNAKDKILDFSGVEITKDSEHSIKWSPLIGVGIMVIGGVIFSVGGNKLIKVDAHLFE